jgi:hypothetical protein
MATFVTFYGYAFEGAPVETSRGWFAAPGVDHLVATRARTALGRASGERVSIFRCAGSLDDDKVYCDEAECVFAGDATENLRWFTLHCARSVAYTWPAPDLVREYLKTVSPSLRDTAHNCAWACSIEHEGPPRIAARVAMYAASTERAIIAAREACRLTGQLAGDRLRAVARSQERALASALLSCTPRAHPDASATLGPRRAPIPDGRVTRVEPDSPVLAYAERPSAEALPPPPTLDARAVA